MKGYVSTVGHMQITVVLVQPVSLQYGGSIPSFCTMRLGIEPVRQVVDTKQHRVLIIIDLDPDNICGGTVEVRKIQGQSPDPHTMPHKYYERFTPRVFAY